MLNLNLGGSTNEVNKNNGFGGDLLGFGSSQNNQTTNFLGGGDLLGFGSNPPQNNNNFSLSTNNTQLKASTVSKPA